jgi:hypothetical protein
MGIRKTHQKFVDEVKKITNGEYCVIGSYLNSKTKVLIKHNKLNCMFEYLVTPSSFMSGSRCPKCFGTPKKTHEIFVKEMALVNPSIKIIGTYNGNKCKIDFYCSEHKINHSAISTSLLRGKGCPECKGAKISNKLSKSHDEFCKELKNITGDEFIVLDQYTTSQKKIKVKHNVTGCQHIYSVTPNNLLRGRGCPKCNNKSKGEIAISNILNLFNISYLSNFIFKDCKNKIALPFDFAIFKNEELLFVIEFDGLQHFQKTGWSKSDEKLLRTQINDKIKNKYCKNNNIKLIRIPYWQLYKINDILKKWLFKFGLLEVNRYDLFIN